MVKLRQSASEAKLHVFVPCPIVPLSRRTSRTNVSIEWRGEPTWIAHNNFRTRPLAGVAGRVVGAIAAIIRICARVARVSAVCEESEGASGARSGYTRGGEGDAELAWAGSEAANGLGVEGPRQG